MNIVYITQEILISFIKKADNYAQLTGLKNLASAFRWKTDFKTWLLNFKSTDYKLRAKSISAYLFNASIEGLKHNLLGPNINMEFLVLTLHTWVILAAGFVVSFPEYIAGRYFGKKNTRTNCPDYSQPGTPFKLCLQ
ncbi:hypothetical protein [Mucilaginibacter gotjawali]|uniref:Uncharacterized protein n=2 Tax=Mucilaginibacter gotjawali TaxID=1550579 RepID=A0A839S9E6_9SPHI|nr:hypothetical protein [Mucilaginibacter gotjawali]MBB3053982.1 hypothetical protein [Mucilaginibacter gotjawali]BAU54247.1 hypothetical protein MgSA37_02421 [Mucilaginibacter gotjawali]